MNYRVIRSLITPAATELICIRRDEIVQLGRRCSTNVYPTELRKIIVYVRLQKRTLEILTNNRDWSAEDIAEMYRSRWQIELFFKWIKEHLRVRGFYGRSENAVRCQVWSAICAYLMVAIVKKELGLKKSLYEILQIISVNPFERIPFRQLVNQQKNHPVSENLQNSFVFIDN